MARSKTSPEAIAHAKKVRDALDLRTAGTAWADIAQVCGWNSAQAAQKAVSKALKDHVAEGVEMNRAIDAKRIDEMIFSIYDKASSGNLNAITRVVTLMKRRARLLGYDAPLKVAATDTKGKDTPSQTKIVVYIPANGREAADNRD
jgi:hypothetical protein